MVLFRNSEGKQNVLVAKLINLFKHRNIYKVICKILFILFCVMVSDEDKLLFELLGKRIKQLRKNAGYTSHETFAYDADVPRALYGKYEKGANITIASLNRILKAHKISFDDFFSEGFEELYSDL
jgi:hypothetical protein